MSMSIYGSSSCCESGNYQPRIGIKLEISNDIPLLHSNGPRKLACLIPRTCRTVRDVKCHIKSSWCQENFPSTNLELLIGNYSLVDEDEVDIFTYYKGESVLAYMNSKTMNPEPYSRNFPMISVDSIDSTDSAKDFQNGSFATSSRIHCLSLPNIPSPPQDDTIDKLKTMNLNNPDPDKKTRSARRRERWKRSLLRQLQEKETDAESVNVTTSKGEKRKAGDGDITNVNGELKINGSEHSSPNAKKPRPSPKSAILENGNMKSVPAVSPVEAMEFQNDKIQSDGEDSVYGTPPRSVRYLEEMENEEIEQVRDDGFYARLNKIEPNQLDVGSYVAFKLIELDDRGQPNLSSFKEAMVTEIVNNWVHLEYYKCNTNSQSFLEQYQVEGFDYGDELVNPKKVQISNFYQLRECPKPAQGT